MELGDMRWAVIDGLTVVYQGSLRTHMSQGRIIVQNKNNPDEVFTIVVYAGNVKPEGK